MEKKIIKVDNKEYETYTIPLMKKKLLLIKAPKGYVMCGYLNKEIAEKFGDNACVVTGVKTIEAMVKSNIAWASESAYKLGITVEMPVDQVLSYFS